MHHNHNMMSLPTAKVLFFIAMNVGPHNPSQIYATSNSEGYFWSETKAGWTVEAKGFPASDFTRDPSETVAFSGKSARSSVPEYLRDISKYDWNHDNAMVFDNGDRIEKKGDHAFYIINAGGANQKVFTILFPKDDSDKS